MTHCLQHFNCLSCHLNTRKTWRRRSFPRVYGGSTPPGPQHRKEQVHHSRMLSLNRDVLLQVPVSRSASKCTGARNAELWAAGAAQPGELPPSRRGPRHPCLHPSPSVLPDPSGQLCCLGGTPVRRMLLFFASLPASLLLNSLTRAGVVKATTAILALPCTVSGTR